MQKNTLMTLRMSTINKSNQDIKVPNHEKLCPVNEAGFTIDTHNNMLRHYVQCKKRMYLRNQILAVRNTFSDEEWLRYAQLHFGSTVQYDPFSFHEVS